MPLCVWQYPGEEETVWNACSFLQHLPGRDEVVPEGTGVVRIYHVLVSANSRAETVEELEGRRKRVVVQVLDTLHADVCRAVDAAAKTAEFKARVAQDKEPKYYTDKFNNSIKDESAARVAVYKALPDGAYAAIEVLGGAVSKSLALPLLANAKLRLWLEDPSLALWQMGEVTASTYLGLNAAQGRRLAQRRLRLQDSSDAGRLDGVGRIVVEDGLGRMGRKATAALALEDCRERRLVTGAGAAALERKDPYSGETPIIAQVQLGEYENAKRLLQAGADANAATAGGERALLIAAKEGREDLMELLLGFKAEVDARDKSERTPLHASAEMGQKDALLALLQAGAAVDARDKDERTPLHTSAYWDQKDALLALLQAGAAVDARSKSGRTPLHISAYWGQKDALLALLQAGAAVDARDKDGWTPLHLSAEKGHTDALLALLQAGSAVDAKDNEGRTALDIAKRYQEAEVVAMLRAAGARE
jgi:ankyrin repeat protein